MHNLPIMLKKFRIDKNINQNDLAKLLKTSQPVYSRYEKGEREPDLNTLIILADYYNTSLDILAGRYINK